METRKLKDKFRLWFMPTGWHPEDVQHRSRGKLANLNDFKPWRIQHSRKTLNRAFLVFILLACINQSLYAFSLPTAVSVFLLVLLVVGLYFVGAILNSELND